MRQIFLSLIAIPTIVHHGMPTNCKFAPFPEKTSIPVQEIPKEVKESKCLAVMVYGEARGEPHLGQIGVAYTAVNRAKKITVCEVVLSPYQYSVFNDNSALKIIALSPNLKPKYQNMFDEKAWQQAWKIAQDVLRRKVPDPTNGATHYLAPNLMAELGYEMPEWSKEFDLVAIINNHNFYRKSKIKPIISTPI
jgi:spore germination cell wall hydrolase CwlJ-like protein